jgi:hypothetical protein
MFLLNRHLRGNRVKPLGFAACQAVVQCLISQVAITGAHVALCCVLPFAGIPPGLSESTESV